MFKEPSNIWMKYSKLKEYCTKKELYTTVARNEHFYDGEQWIDVNGKEIKTDMPKPVINVLQRVAKSQISVVSSNDIAVTITPFSMVNRMLKQQVLSQNRLKKYWNRQRSRKTLRQL